MTNADRILQSLDTQLDSTVDLTLYGRAALLLGYDDPPDEFALSRDVDAVFWVGQAEELLEHTNFWSAVEAVNDELSGDDLYISHFFSEEQVALTPEWRENRARVVGDWRRLDLHRLGDEDLLLSKLMRDDPLDQRDARFICDQAGISAEMVRALIGRVRLPESQEVHEQFESASMRLLSTLSV